MQNHNPGLSFWVTHWVRFVCMIILVASGFYIAQPYIMPDANIIEPVNFLQAEIRFWHIVFGLALFCATLIKTYLFFFGKESQIERESFANLYDLKQWISRIRFYLTLNGKIEDRGLYNPLQFVVYLGVYIALYGIIFTGFILAIHIYHNGMFGMLYPILSPMESWFGGIANIRWIHHILTWVFLLFLPVHIYLVVMQFLFAKSYKRAHS